MGKSLFIAEKPMVARAFAAVFNDGLKKMDGYLEGNTVVVTWCVGHLVTMSYPEDYNESLKRWSMETLPFIPEKFRYKVIPGVKKQFNIVKGLLNRPDVTRIYVCTDSGREGEYIYRLVREAAKVHGKDERRVWIDSQTDEEIKRGIREAKPESEYDSLSDAAYLRAKEDYLMGINFSRLLTLKYGNQMASFLHTRYQVIAVGRVMTCVLGMVVRREIEIRKFEKTFFYRLLVHTGDEKETGISFEWRSLKDSIYFNSTLLYKENGFKARSDAAALAAALVGREIFPREAPSGDEGEKRDIAKAELTLSVVRVQRKDEKKNPPLLYNLAEIQNDASKLFKISPDQTLTIIQSLYEKKLVTYPRTDARVLSSAIAKEIDKNIRGLQALPLFKPFCDEILETRSYQKIGRSRYTDDKKITDHYAIIPTGQGLSALKGLSATEQKVYEVIARRFLAIFFPQAVYKKTAIEAVTETDGQGHSEHFFANEKYLDKEGYLKVMKYSFSREKEAKSAGEASRSSDLASIRKGDKLGIHLLEIKEGETSPPKRYTSGSMILAMENAGSLIEDEELREQIKSNGIGTSATRAGILDKLVKNKYLSLNKKTQVITPTLTGEMIYYVVGYSIAPMLDPKLTASWEKGLSQVERGEIEEREYMEKLSGFIIRYTDTVKQQNNSAILSRCFESAARFYGGRERS